MSLLERLTSAPEAIQDEPLQPVLTTVDRVFTPPMRDTEWLTLSTAPLALFVSVDSDGLSHYTAFFDYNLARFRLKRFLSAIAPLPNQQLSGMRADWNFLYSGKGVTNQNETTAETFNGRQELTRDHSKYLPKVWAQFMHHHAAPLIDAAFNGEFDGPALFVIRHLGYYLLGQDQNSDELRAEGITNISKISNSKGILEYKRRIALQYDFDFFNLTRTQKSFVTPNQGKIVADTLSLAPVLQWTVDETGQRHLNTRQVEDQEVITWGLNALRDRDGEMAKSLETSPTRLSTLLGVSCLAYFTADVRERKRWAKKAQLDPNRKEMDVSEAQVPIRVLESVEELSHHPFLTASEEYLATVDRSRSHRAKIAISSVIHGIRTPVNHKMQVIVGDIM